MKIEELIENAKEKEIDIEIYISTRDEKNIIINVNLEKYVISWNQFYDEDFIRGFFHSISNLVKNHLI